MKSRTLASSILLLAFVGLISKGQGFVQELWLYNDEGNALYFTNNVADLSEYRGLLDKVTKGCATGWWNVYTIENFIGNLQAVSFGDAASSNKTCNSNLINGTTIKSLRHWGNNDTSIDALSLYGGEQGFDGEELLITGKAKTDISHQIYGVVGTGTADWTLYEGKDLDGKSLCFQVPQSGHFMNWSKVSQLNVTTIGSVFRGCDTAEIQAYKTQHSL